MPPAISFTKVKGGFRRHSKWVEKLDVDDDPADAMCNFVSDLIDTFIEEHQGTLGVHAAAICFQKGLVVIPTTHRSGKSLLATHLVQQGGTLFSDDVLLIPPQGRKGMATGIAPRLRLPLPKDARSTLPSFLDVNGMCANHRYGWVRLQRGQIASLGEKAPICGIVMLDRQDGYRGQPRLYPLPRAEGLSQLVRRGFALEAEASDVLGRLTRVAEQADCYQLRYGSTSQAADLLTRTFNAPSNKKVSA